MGMEDFSRHQQKIIKRYYENFDAISLQKLSELCTDLYLAEGKKLAKLWDQAAALMTKMGVKSDRVAAIIAAQKPEMVATLVAELGAES